MQRRASFPSRIRKLSDAVKNAIVPTPKPTDPAKRSRKISTDDIGKPALDPAYSIQDLIRPTTTQDGGRPRRPDRPRVDQRPFVIRDAEERERERAAHRQTNTVRRRPERPREEDLPYGAKGSMPIRVTPTGGAVPFPNLTKAATETRQGGPPRTAPPPTARAGGSVARDRSPPGSSRATFSPFAPLKRAASVQSARTAETAISSTARIEPPTSTRPTEHDGNTREPRGQHRAAAADKTASVYCAPAEPATVRRHGAIRRAPNTSPLHLQDRFGRSEDTLLPLPPPTPTPPPASLQRAQSLAAQSRHARERPPPSARRPMPDVPRDVRARLSGESSSAERAEPLLVPPARVGERARANLPLRHPPPALREVRLTAPDLRRVASVRAQVGHVGGAPRAEAALGGAERAVGRRRWPGEEEEEGEGRATVVYYHLTEFFKEGAEGNALPGGEGEVPLRVQKKKMGAREGERDEGPRDR
ncbi:hypothetical protein BC628DRAFT_1335970 [Trametes gibbosa]|nr:hypothetical protein BC628DRAFT_1335970 [Trametes gibbosa]